MKEPEKTYVGAAMFFERMADDGWPEDAGLWPMGAGWPSPPPNPHERVEKVNGASLFQRFTSVLRSRIRSKSQIAAN